MTLSIFNKKSETESEKAESYMRSASHGIRDHYTTQGVQDILTGKVGKHGHIANISDSEVERIQRKLNK